MKLSRTSTISFGWLYVFPLLDVVFLLIFFFLLSSSFVLQPGIAVTVPFSRFTLGPQPNQQIISITGGPNPAIYLRDQKVTLAELGPALDVTKREGRSIVIKADRLVSYDLVMAVTNAALDTGFPPLRLPLLHNIERGELPASTRRFAFSLGTSAPAEIAIAGFLLASAALHALCFYLFQVVYPPAISLLPPPAQVSLIAPTSNDAQAFLNWLDAEDPALAAQTERPADARAFQLPKLAHVPSYLAVPPKLKELPARGMSHAAPAAMPAAPVLVAAASNPVRHCPPRLC